MGGGVVVEGWSSPGGGTWSGKGYYLRSDHCGAVAVAMRDGYKRGAVILSYCKIRELSESLHPIYYNNCIHSDWFMKAFNTMIC